MELDPHEPRPAGWWSENDGPVLWWKWEGDRWAGEPPYVGTPLDTGYVVEIRSSDQPEKTKGIYVGGWPGYHTHWTPIGAPNPPAVKKKTSQ